MLYTLFSDFTIPVRVRFYILFASTLVMGVVTVFYIVSLIKFLTRKKVSKLSLQFGSADDSAEKVEKAKLVIGGIVIALLWVVCITVL